MATMVATGLPSAAAVASPCRLRRPSASASVRRLDRRRVALAEIAELTAGLDRIDQVEEGVDQFVVTGDRGVVGR